MKKFVKFTALALAVGVAGTIAGCSGCAGCSSNAKNTALTNSNWFTGTSYKGIQPSFIIDEDHPEYTKEIITYDVTHEENGTGNKYYSVNYRNGVFRTEFYAAAYDWSDSSIPVIYQTEKTEILYCYRTELRISVQVVMASGESSEWFEDSAVSECYFRAAGENLQPVFSKQEIKSTTPASMQPSSLEEAYTAVQVSCENYYKYDGSEVISLYSENGGEAEEQVYNLSKVKTSLFDNSSLYIAVRSFKLSDSLSQSISLFSAVSGGVSTYQVSGTDTALSENELASVSDALAAQGLYTPDETTKGVPAVAVSVSYTGGTLQGTTQTVWYAAIEDADNNKARATMLKISSPLSYGLGTLNYTLKEVESTLWNG